MLGILGGLFVMAQLVISLLAPAFWLAPEPFGDEGACELRQVELP